MCISMNFKKYKDQTFTTSEAIRILEKYPRGLKFKLASTEEFDKIDEVSLQVRKLSRLNGIFSVGCYINTSGITIPLGSNWILYQEEITMSEAFSVYMDGGDVQLVLKDKVINYSGKGSSDPGVSVPFNLVEGGKWFIDPRREDLWIVQKRDESVQAVPKTADSSTEAENYTITVETQTE